MSTNAKLAALKMRTLANGCTPGEVAAAQAAIERMLAAQPHLTGDTYNPFDSLYRTEPKPQPKPAKPSLGQCFATAVRYYAGKPTKQCYMAAGQAFTWGYTRKEFMEYALAGGYNKNTAGTQWAAATK